MKKDRLYNTILEIIFILATVLIWIPLYYLLIGAFKTRDDIVLHPLMLNFATATLSNFANAWQKMNFFASFRNTLCIAAGALVLLVAFSALAGFAISRIHWKVFDVYYAVMVALMVVPFISCLLPLVRQLRSMGLYNTILGAVLIHVAWHLPFCIFLYVGFMKGIPQELEEAAYIDGASTLQIFTRIFLPLIKPVTATVCIRSGMTIWNDFLISSTMMNTTKMPTLIVSINTFFGKYVNEYGFAFAGILLATLPIALLFIFLQKYFVAGMTAGAVKG